MKSWLFPLKDYQYPLPLRSNGHRGSFSYPRKHHNHEGVDLYCKEGDPVTAVEDGIIVEIKQFTGVEVGSPWWNKTYAVFVKGQSGVVVYGEIIPNPALKKNQIVKEGDLVGNVTAVLKVEKGNPTTMLHIELYKGEITDAVEWLPEAAQPKQLKDPTPFLMSARRQK